MLALDTKDRYLLEKIIIDVLIDSTWFELVNIKLFKISLKWSFVWKLKLNFFFNLIPLMLKLITWNIVPISFHFMLNVSFYIWSYRAKRKLVIIFLVINDEKEACDYLSDHKWHRLLLPLSAPCDGDESNDWSIIYLLSFTPSKVCLGLFWEMFKVQCLIHLT